MLDEVQAGLPTLNDRCAVFDRFEQLGALPHHMNSRVVRMFGDKSPDGSDTSRRVLPTRRISPIRRECSAKHSAAARPSIKRRVVHAILIPGKGVPPN